jgi:splicing factor 3A subunit 3
MRILELIRGTHEICESTELAIGEELDLESRGQKEKTYKEHAIHAHVQSSVNAHKRLNALYEDNDGMLKDEIKALKEGDVFESFYRSLGKTQEYHRKYPDLVVEDVSPAMLSTKVNEVVSVSFSGEEVFGKYLDLNEQHVMYCSLSFVDDAIKEDYLTFLDKFLDFGAVNEKAKEREKKGYFSYLQSLVEYLMGFLARVQPLVNTNKMITEWEREFGNKWSKGDIEGWTVSGDVAESGSNNNDIDLDSYTSARDLEAVGTGRLRAVLELRGLKAGGTAPERAKRLWSTRGLAFEEIPKKLKAKGVVSPPPSAKETSSSSPTTVAVAPVTAGKRALAWSEFLVTRLSELILDVVHNTRSHAEKQQTRSAEEKQRELLEEERGLSAIVGGGVDDSDEEEETPVHNPLKLPLGWDGKPIPFWMYRLHGLNEEFKCEICGDETYKGRRNFDRHFSESRHTGNLRLLGIPNLKHFHGVTKIQDAMALYAKISTELAESKQREEVEEFEDSSGAVMDRHTFEVRARSGQL